MGGRHLAAFAKAFTAITRRGKKLQDSARYGNCESCFGKRSKDSWQTILSGMDTAPRAMPIE